MSFSERLWGYLANGSSLPSLAGKREAPATLAGDPLPMGRGWLSLPVQGSGLQLKLQGRQVRWRLRQVPQLVPSPDAQWHVACLLPVYPLPCHPVLVKPSFHLSHVSSPHTQSLRTETGLGDSGRLFTVPAPPSTAEAGHGLRTVCGRLSPLSQEAPQAFLPPGSSCQRASPDLTVASPEDSSAPAGPVQLKAD